MTVRVVQRLVALTAVIWHNDPHDPIDPTGQPVNRSLVAYDH